MFSLHTLGEFLISHGARAIVIFFFLAPSQGLN